LANSGVSMSLILSVGLQQFNGVSNPGIGLATHESDTNPSIRELMHHGEVLRQADRLSADVETTGKGKPPRPCRLSPPPQPADSMWGPTPRYWRFMNENSLHPRSPSEIIT
jgi:hypothetical protein